MKKKRVDVLISSDKELERVNLINLLEQGFRHYGIPIIYEIHKSPPGGATELPEDLLPEMLVLVASGDAVEPLLKLAKSLQPSPKQVWKNLFGKPAGGEDVPNA